MDVVLANTNTEAVGVQLLEPQLGEGQWVFQYDGDELPDLVYAMQEKGSVRIYAVAGVEGDTVLCHRLAVGNIGSEPFSLNGFCVTDKSAHSVTPLLEDRATFSTSPISLKETVTGLLCFECGAISERLPITLNFAIAGEEFICQFDRPQENPTRVGPHQWAWESWFQAHPQAQSPPAPYGNGDCLCLACSGCLWSPFCTEPVNMNRPHIGPNCPYCNTLLMAVPVERFWDSSLDPLYKALGYDRASWCARCTHIL